MEISFCDLKQKEVVNICDGRRLGKVVDLVIGLSSCKVLGIVVPGNRKIFNTKEDIFIPWRNIQKIGDDVVLVQLTMVNQQCSTNKSNSTKCKEVKNIPSIVNAEGFAEETDFTFDDE